MAIGDTDVELEFTNVAANVPIVVGIQNTGVQTEILVRYSSVKYPATLGVDYALVFPVDLLTLQVTPTQSLIDKIIAAQASNVIYVQRILPLTSDFDYDNAFVRQKLVDEFNRVWMAFQQSDYKLGDLQDANAAADAAAISANNAAVSAAAAHQSDLNADASEAAALVSKNAAAGSATAAATSATNSANSATASQNSAVASAASAADAANSAAISTQKVSKAGDTMTGALNLPAGTVSVPALTFGTGNSGFYATGTGASAVLKAEVNAVDKLAVDANAVTPSVPLRAAAGAVGAPSISFTAEATAGFYRAGAGDIRFAMNGADVVKWLNDKSETHFGPIVLPADPTTALQAATKQYVDAQVAVPPNPTPTTKGGVKSYGPVVNQFLKAITTTGDVTSALIGPTDLPDPTAATKGGVKAIAPVGGSFMTSIGTDGTPTLAPATSGPPPAPSPAILGGVFSKAPVAGQYVNGVDTAGNVLTTALVAADILTPLKTVDGTGSGLDADLLDGLDSTAFATAANAANKVLKAGDTMTGPLHMPLGSAAANSIDFGTVGTGIHGLSTNQVNVASIGVDRLSISSTFVYAAVPYWGADGAVGAPAYSWVGEANSGFYRAAAGDVRLSMGGNDVVKFLSSDKSATFTGAVIGVADPTVALGMATKQYVDGSGGATITKVVTRYFTTVGAGTYTPTAGMVYALVECVGGGGGGGGEANCSAGNHAGSGGGGGGAYSRKLVTAADIGASKPITVGNGGGGGSAAGGNGADGGATSLGTAPVLCLANGGNNGTGGPADTAGSSGPGGAVAGGVGDLLIPGGAGTSGTVGANAAYNLSSGGGPSGGGFGARTPDIIGLLSGVLYGGGGSGAHIRNGSGASAGAAGAQGLLMITEFCH